MTRPTARVLALLEILEGGGTHTTAHLADRLGVDERTVRRYAGHLVELGVPVESVRGRYGGYRLAPGFRMPPLMLTDEEALAVVLGLVAGARAGLHTAPPEAADTAAAKVRRVLPKPLARRLEALLATTGFTTPVRESPKPESETLLRVAEAARQRRPVVIGYVDRGGRRSERTVLPYGVVAHAGRWYLTGPDAASGEQRTFRLDRIERLRPGDGTFTVPEGFQPAEAVLNSLAGTPWRHRVTLAVRGTADDVRAKLPRGIATVEPGEPGWVEVELRAERLDWLPAVIAGLGSAFVIREPARLRELVRAWAGRVAGCATATSTPEGALAWETGS